MSGERISGGDIVQCAGCCVMEQGVAQAALPVDWNALFIAGEGWVLFCPECIASGRMEEERAGAGLQRREHWRYPDGIMGIYRPAAREVLIATPDGMAVLSEADAERLIGALSGALATRDHAAALVEAHAHAAR